MVAEQLKMFEEVPKSLYYREVERILYNYPILKASIENVQELEREGLGQSKQHEKLIRFKQIERALEALNIEEMRLVEMKYFNRCKRKDYAVYNELGYGSTYYYAIKDRAIRKIAQALNII